VGGTALAVPLFIGGDLTQRALRKRAEDAEKSKKLSRGNGRKVLGLQCRVLELDGRSVGCWLQDLLTQRVKWLKTKRG